MSVQREQFPVTCHFLLTTRRNRNWRFRSVLFCDHSKSRKRRRSPDKVRHKSNLRRNQQKHPRWVPDPAPEPKGSLFFRLLGWKLTAVQSTAECTEEDGWFWPCFPCSDSCRGWCGTSGVPSRTRPFALMALPSLTSRSWFCGARWASSPGCCLCGYWTKKVSCSFGTPCSVWIRLLTEFPEELDRFWITLSLKDHREVLQLWILFYWQWDSRFLSILSVVSRYFRHLTIKRQERRGDYLTLISFSPYQDRWPS